LFHVLAGTYYAFDKACNQMAPLLLVVCKVDVELRLGP